MSKLIQRSKDTAKLKKLIKLFPVTALLGPRQCGKTVLAKQFKSDHYFDLENPRDLARLAQPQLTFESLQGLIVIDEIQRMPDLFPLLRYIVDSNPNQKYLILGSASRDLIRQTSESLAGRVAYYYLGGFRLIDIGYTNTRKLWIRGGFPKSYLAGSQEASIIWRENYITTFLERDIPQLGLSIPANTLRRFWTMLSHYHGQLLNYSELARSFGISDVTVRRYIDILAGTFMVRIVQPWHVNVGKRLIKRPKMYITDSGLFHTLMSIGTEKELFSHNKLGASWEGFALEVISQNIEKRHEEMYFWSTHTGAEIDLFWQNHGKNWGVEFKYSDAPQLTKSMQVAINDLNLSHLWVVYPGKETYPLSESVTVLAIKDIIQNMKNQKFG